ncbi:APC family permease [Propioniciclava soli]|uniref:APC family permease n=1 Tax=Propioniciclava soli TaxID=2775081 RepID=UPI001E2FB71F|nr:APC family permease [Propioniciclava soli]
MAEPSTTPHAEPELKRVMGPGLLLLFIIGDILGTGIYALTGTVAREVGGVVWLPFLVAFAVALMTAFSYLELVTKYPHAGGAAVFTHKAFRIGFLTFMVAFTVMASGITSSATASRAFAENFMKGFGLGTDPTIVTVVAIWFMLLVMGVNLYGVAESVKANVVLTCIELSGLLLVIFVGFLAMSSGRADFSRVLLFETPQDKGWFLALSAATSVAFFAMVGFEDSVNMAEETKNPSKIFPPIMLTGLGITGVIYVLVSMTAVAIVPIGELTETGATPLLTVVEMGAPGLPFGAVFPFISMFAVANTALINMMMASRLLYGMGRQLVLPHVFSRVLPSRRTPWVSILFTTGLAIALITFVGQVSQLGGTTALLLLAVFTLVNVAVLVLRRDTVAHSHFRAPTWLPVVAGLCTFYLVGPWTGRPLEQFTIALVLIAIGAVLGFITFLVNKALRQRPTRIEDVDLLDEGGVRN